MTKKDWTKGIIYEGDDTDEPDHLRGGLPKTWLSAYRPDSWRYERLARLIGSIEKRVGDSDTDGLGYQRWIGGLYALNDDKGDLTAVWRSDVDRQTFGPLLDAAWNAEGEREEISHRIGRAELENLFKWFD